MNVIEIPLSEIDVSDRLRAIDEDYAALIAASISEEGQRTPVEVRKLPSKLAKKGFVYALIAGGHRMRALEIAGKESAFAIVLEASDLKARLLEIDENLCRRELSALDRATFLAERKRVYEEMHPETKNGGDRKSDQFRKLAELIPAFNKATADRLGISQDTIERAVKRHSGIPPDVRDLIASTWLADSGAQLDALVKLAPDMQRQVARRIVDYPGLRSVGDAVREVTKAPPIPPQTVYEKLLGLWRKASAADQARFLEYLAPSLPGAIRKEAA
ncbi:ParB N-terminal domain-containing protein [Acetobacter sp. DsW_063]|uniref:ParB/RepB/Spo0J family partition protein n=1 Tax=Acetobacter sp. DsW_063 TaxID=1514894 RepID=UPI000A39E70C|nr:ParB N-terminal domain-containing protein [Acetobacter sp. DsW_063]